MEKMRKALLLIALSAVVILTEPYFSTSVESKIILFSIVSLLIVWHYFRIDSRIPVAVGIMLLLFSSFHVIDMGPSSQAANQFAGYALYFIAFGISIQTYEYFSRRS